MKRFRCPFLLLILCIPTTARCAEIPSMGSMLLKMTWALLIVAGLILILYGLLRKKMGVYTAGGGNIRILEVKPVMYKNSLALIEVHGKEMLVGVNQSGIQLLTEFPSTDSKPSSFKETLRQEQ